MLIGQTLSTYRITAALGAGGMGEVYRATDTKLGREVAIKVLPAEMANDAGRLERFQREAHLLAALNHPHIAAIHGLEEAEGKPFLVLELVEGEDLKERLARGAMPVDEALEIAVQVAEALEAAHNAGIVHRDLKPANVKVTPDGKVKVLDFGLAKAWAGDAAEGGSPSASMSQSPTLAHSGTQAGVILGTAAYMSPEQARGKPVDKRTDVWAFGVLLWEMLTGRTLFAGDTVTDVIAAVVKEEPDLDAPPAETPRAVRWLLARCLRKDPRARLPDVGSARLTLQDVLGGTAPEAEAADHATASLAAHPQRTRERWAWATVSLLATAIAVTLALVLWTEAPERRPAAHFTIDAPEGWSLLWALPSPDGRHIVMNAQRGGEDNGRASTMLWLYSLESGTARLLEDTEGAGNMFWSPDGRSIGFDDGEGELRRLSLDDGSIRRICVLPGPAAIGADWNEEGTILFGGPWMRMGNEPAGLYTVPAAGGDPKLLLAADPARGESFLVALDWLPGGQRFLFAAIERGAGGIDYLGTYIGSLDQPDERRLLMADATLFRLAGEHVLFSREDTLFAQSFDVEHAELRGEPVAVAPSVTLFGHGGGRFAVSPEGPLVYITGEEEKRVQLTWLDRAGQPVGTLGEPGLYSQLSLSPDERRLALQIPDSNGQSDVWVMDVSRGVATRVTSDPAVDSDPIWSSDGQELFFARPGESGRIDIFRTGLHRGASAVPLLESSERHDWPEDVTRDGKTLLLDSASSGEISLWTLQLGDESVPEIVAKTEGFQLRAPRLSPDGRWVAYTSNESGQYEVYVEPFRRPGDRVRISVDGGGQPRWRGDGKELFYRDLEGPLMAVDMRDEPEGLEVGLPIELFAVGELGSVSGKHYAVSADGQRFLVKVAIEDENELQLHVIANWESLLEQQ